MRYYEGDAPSRGSYMVLSGDSRIDMKVLERLCDIHNGPQIKVWFPGSTIPRRTGLNALDAVNLYPGKFKCYSFIYVADREHFRRDARAEIQAHLAGVQNIRIESIQQAYVLKGRVGPHEIILYCIISGSQACIEEEIARLIELELGIPLDLSGNMDAEGRARLKRDIRQTLHDNRSNIEDLIMNAQTNHLNRAFPNFCAVLRTIKASY